MISLTGFFEMKSLKDGVSRTVQIYDVSGIIHGVNFEERRLIGFSLTSKKIFNSDSF